MRFTVTGKILGALAMVILVAAAALLNVYGGLSRVVEEIRELAEVREPGHQAALEVELNVNGMIMGALAYLDRPDPRHRKLILEEERDIAVFLERYRELAGSDTARALVARLDTLYQDLRLLTDDLLASRDRQFATWEGVTRDLERADSIIELDLAGGVVPNDPSAAAKLAAFGTAETELAEVAISLANYRSGQRPRRALVAADAEEFRAALRRLRDLPLDQPENRQLAALSAVFERAMGRVQPVYGLEDRLRDESRRLLELHSRLDNLLDDEIQAPARQQLYQPRQTAEQVAATVLRRLQWLLPLVLVVAAVTSALLIRSIGRSIRQLKQGAETVGRGDLTHRITLAGTDELAEVAAEFNRMVGQLQATTVSKELLERSEQRLRESVAQLQEEITERQRGELERRQLERSLRHTETMSAMGALVAGVAHEVRNPLFGILSVLEAMDARFEGREEYRRYLALLREQARRLNQLMREVLEYGKPSRPELVNGSITGVLEEALAASRPVAERAGVRLTGRLAAEPACLELDRSRLLRVFTNLLENAIQHTPAGSAVTLESRTFEEDGERCIQCAVADDGPGIAAEDLPYIFQPFYTRRPGGTGLGLSIVQRIVQEHGGRLTAANRADGGAVMTVRLPVGVRRPAVCGGA